MNVHTARRAVPVTLKAKPLLVPAVLLFSLVLVRAPILMGHTQLTLLPFVAAILSLTIWRAGWRACPWVLLAGAYLALVVIAAIRGRHLGILSQNAMVLEVVQLTLIALLGMFAFLRETSEHKRSRYLRALCWAPIAYVAVNVALYFAGVTAPNASEGSHLAATTLQALGIPMTRVQFPLASGVNAFGPICAIAFALSATLALGGEQRTLAILGALVSLYAILAIDSRGALVFGLLAVALVKFIPRARRRGLGWVAISLPLLPILLMLTLGALSSSLSASLSRNSTTGAQSITDGTGRTVVWQEAAKTMIKPSLGSVLGYGRDGQITSGTSVGYAYLFRGHLVDPLTASAHNMVLQTGLDLGWLGILCVLTLAAVVLVRLSRHAGNPLYTALLAAALAALLIGIVEAAPTPSNPESFIFWMLTVFTAMRPSDLPGEGNQAVS